MNNKTELVFIIDRSGSMAGLESDTIGGFNSLIEQQRQQPGEVFVSTVLFSSYSQFIHDRVALDKVPVLNEDTYRVGGNTALMDAVGDAIRHIRNVHKYARPEDVPDKTLFVITTDGMENASRRYSHAVVKRMIQHQQEECGWEFLFLGADIDAFAAAKNIGIRQGNAVRYRNREDIRDSYAAVSRAVSHVRFDLEKSAMLSENWKAELEEKVRRAEER